VAVTSGIPILDIADYLAGLPGALEEAARRVEEALTTVGFFVLTGHDVPAASIEARSRRCICRIVCRSAFTATGSTARFELPFQQHPTWSV